MKLGWMKGGRIVICTYLALQKLSFVFFQRHRLNGIIVLINTVALGESLANILTIRY